MGVLSAARPINGRHRGWCCCGRRLGANLLRHLRGRYIASVLIIDTRQLAFTQRTKRVALRRLAANICGRATCVTVRGRLRCHRPRSYSSMFVKHVGNCRVRALHVRVGYWATPSHACTVPPEDARGQTETDGPFRSESGKVIYYASKTWITRAPIVFAAK